MKKLFSVKKITAIFLAVIIAAGSLFISGCSEGDINTVLEVASVALSEMENVTEESGINSNETYSGQKETKKEKATKKKEKTTKQQTETKKETEATTSDTENNISEDGKYYSDKDVAEYIHVYGHLPDNYITKDEAYDLGWEPSDGNLWDVAYGMCIGGDKFYNSEGNLPKKKGKKYYECDVNYSGGYRGAERIVYSSDGYIYYTKDHYDSFTELYSGE